MYEVSQTFSCSGKFEFGIWLIALSIVDRERITVAAQRRNFTDFPKFKSKVTDLKIPPRVGGVKLK